MNFFNFLVKNNLLVVTVKNEMKFENRREKEQIAEKTREMGIYFKNSAF